MNNAKSRVWCWTINNYSDTDIAELSALCSTPGGPSFVCSGKEAAPSTGTPHLQCFAYWPSTCSGQRWSWLRSRLTRAAHIEPAYSTAAACIAYCEKENDVLTWGTRPKLSQGRRSDLEDVRLDLEQGYSLKSVARKYFSSFCKYHRAFDKYAAMQVVPRDFKSKVIWLHGPAGCGKTKWCYDNYPLLVSLEFQKGFFSNYNGQETVLFDDYDHSTFPEELICRILDRYPFQLRQIGGWTEFCPRTILITSNYPPPDTARMKRRIELVMPFE